MEESMNECNVLWCGEYRQNWENELHNHTFFQLFAFSEGHGSIMIENDTFPVFPQQIYLIQPQQFHSIHVESNQVLHILDIKFSIQNPMLFEDLIKIPMPFIPNNYSWFIHIFERIIRESAAQMKYYHSLICNHLFEMLVTLIRETSKNTESALPFRYMDNPLINTYHGIDVPGLLEYINFNYSRIISLDDLASAAHASKTMLTTMFKELFSTTPIRYVNAIRMQKAKELLVNTDISVGEIAELVGFQSIHYFSRFFKSKENCAPIEYRIRNSKNQFFTFS